MEVIEKEKEKNENKIRKNVGGGSLFFPSKFCSLLVAARRCGKLSSATMAVSSETLKGEATRPL